MEFLIEQERNARLEKNEDLLKKTFLTMLQHCHSDEEVISLLIQLGKRKGQIKEVLAWFINYNFNMKKEIYENENTNDSLNRLINFCVSLLKEVIEGKMFLEKERITVSEYLKCTFERIGETKKALDIVFDIPIETFSSIKEEEVISFQLEQLRLAILNKEWIKADVSSKKIRSKYFLESNDLEKEVIFYSLLTDLNLGQKLFLQAAKFLFSIAEKSNSDKYVIYSSFYALISDRSSEKEEMIKKLIFNKNNHEKIRKILSLFLKDELIKHEVMNGFTEFMEIESFSEEICKSIDVHNLCVISKFCTFISINDLSVLLFCTPEVLIDKVCWVVNNRLLDCKIDQNEGLIRFNKSLEEDWMSSIDNIMGRIVEAKHLIDKEYMENTE